MHTVLQHRLSPRGRGLRPWANSIDTGTDSVVLINNDGSNKIVAVNQGGWFHSIQESADGKSAVFIAEATDTNTGYIWYQIFLGTAAGNTFNATQLTSDAEDHYQAQLSFDGKQVVFVKDDGQAYVMSASPNATETLIPNLADFDVVSPTFTPDGKSIVFEDCGMDSINFVNVDGSGSAVLNNPGDSGRSLDDTPSVSPDGKLIAFLSDNDVYVMDITGQNVKPLTTDAMNDDPMFVNGKIVYLSWRDETGFAEIYSMNPDGSNPKRLTNEAAPKWLQDYDENY